MVTLTETARKEIEQKEKDENESNTTQVMICEQLQGLLNLATKKKRKIVVSNSRGTATISSEGVTLEVSQPSLIARGQDLKDAAIRGSSILRSIFYLGVTDPSSTQVRVL